MTAATWLIVVAVVVLAALVAAIVLQQRRSADRPTDSTEAEALSAAQRQQDRGGWTP